MRTIKFRAWSRVHKDMRLNPSLSCKDGVWSLRQKGPSTLLQEDMILEQFTGLKDKNGHEIYEGDIVRGTKTDGFYHLCIGQVQWNQADAGFHVVGTTRHPDSVRTDKRDYWQISGAFFDSIEILGNIHENLDLLK